MLVSLRPTTNPRLPNVETSVQAVPASEEVDPEPNKNFHKRKTSHARTRKADQLFIPVVDVFQGYLR